MHVTEETKQDSQSSRERSDASASRRKRSREEYERFYVAPRVHPLLRPFTILIGWWSHWQFGRILLEFLHEAMLTLVRILRFRPTAAKVEAGAEGKAEWPSSSTLANPLWWVVWSASFFWSWLTSRSFGPLLLALPGVTIFACVFALATRGSQVSEGTEVIHYRNLLAIATENQDLDRARFLSDALMRVSSNSKQDKYVRALVEAEVGEESAAKSMMERLAKEQGSSDAAMWLAEKQRIPGLSILDWPNENQRQYFDSLVLAISNAPNDPKPRRLIGDLYRQINRPEKAYEYMAPIAEASVDDSCLVAFLENQLGLKDKARKRAEPAARSLELHVLKNPIDSVARTRLAMLWILLGRTDESVVLLEEGIELATEPAEIRTLKNALAEALVTQAREILGADDSPRGMMNSLEKLRQAMNTDPSNKSLLDSVIEFSLKAANSTDRELLILREAIIQGVSSDASHFVLGTTCLMRGELESANRHLEIALKNNPTLPGVLNNLAYTLMMQPNADLERALRLSEAALNSLPDNPYLRDTRGQIFLKLGRYSEAISDLEFAMRSPELSVSVRPKLIQAYDAIGETVIAERHRSLMQRGK